MRSTRSSAHILHGRRGSSPQPLLMPVFGQHITADGTAVTHYMNSYIGARANTECFIGQYSAALVGKTPEYGFHLTENRIGKTLFDIKVKLRDETDWSALGYYISRTLGKNYWDVPVINGINPAEIQTTTSSSSRRASPLTARSSIPSSSVFPLKRGPWSRPSAGKTQGDLHCGYQGTSERLRHLLDQ